MKLFNSVSVSLLCALLGISTGASAQAPDLEKKADLPTTLLQNKSYAGEAASTDKLSTPVPGDSYTIEVKGKFSAGTGRGLDILANDATGLGYRVSMDAASLAWTNPTTSSTTLSSTDNTQLRTLRFAVADKKVNIYEDGYYIATRALESIPEALTSGDDINPEVIPSGDWGSSKPTPASKGWTFVKTDNTLGTVPSNARFEASPGSNTPVYSDGTKLNGNFFFIRWDSNNTKNCYYVYGVDLEANTTYTFSMDCAYWANSNASTVIVTLSDDPLVKTSLASHVFKTNGAKKLVPGEFTFTTTTAGKYYLAFSSAWALYAITNLKLVPQKAEPQILIGKDYEGEASMEVEYVTYDATGAFAPAEQSGSRTSLTFDNAGDVTKGFIFNTDITVSGATSLHLAGDNAPMNNTTVNLSGNDAWLYLDYVKPSKAISDYLQYVTIDGQPAVAEENCRITVWGNGSVIIPNGQANDAKALVAYDGDNFTGNSKEFEINTFHNELGEWDNKVRSFKLKKGYMATLANNANGTGYSRVFIADTEDLEVATLPEGMSADEGSFVSFIRVFRWNWVSKKGKANGYSERHLLNTTCDYNWNINGTSTDPDVEYSAIRQNLGWPSWTDIKNKQGVTHLLGQNEPDRPDQSNCTVDQVVEQWPEMLKTGYRLGSPAPSSVWTWNGNFFNTIDSLNYRVDFAVAHIYESTSADGLVSRIKTLSDKGKGRPVWITEWNNGANWTTESWPTASGEQRDADCNIIYDENGGTTTVNRPLSPENAEKQRAYMAAALPALDDCGLIERYFEYDWVQDCRKLVIGGKLTPAGKVYSDHKAALAYRKANAYDHVWKIAPPFPLLSVDKDYKNITVKWYDHNGETGKKYVLERKMDDETEFTAYKDFVLGTDYQAGETVTFTEAIPCTATVTYRIKAISYKDTESIYSREKAFTRDAEVAAPVLKGEALSTSIIKLSWEAVSGAKSYRLERATAADGEYTVIADNLTATEYTDEGLTADTKYYYRGYSINSSAEHPASAVLEVSTLQFVAPSAAMGLRISGGANSASLRWTFAYDAVYRILRATEANGTFTVVADKVEGTSYVDEGLTNGQTYYYKVQPWNEAGNGPESEVLSATPAAGKYLHLAFDEGEGTVAYDEWGCYDGVFKNAAAFTEGRNEGHAVQLTKSSKSYVELPEGALSRLSDFTIATWVNVSGGKGRIFDFGSGTKIFMIAAANSTGLRYKITCDAGSFDTTAPMTWATEGWDHVVITQKGEEMNFYQNGELVHTATNSSLIYPKDMGTTTQNWLGRSQWSSDAYAGHVYDDFRIYNVALDAEGVAALYADKEPVIDDGKTPSGIEEITRQTENDAIYTLSGVKVNKMHRGIYIVNGKKRVVK